MLNQDSSAIVSRILQGKELAAIPWFLDGSQVRDLPELNHERASTSVNAMSISYLGPELQIQ